MNDLVTLLPSFIQGIQGMSMLNDGAEIAVGGAKMEAGAFRTAGTISAQGYDFAGLAAINGSKYSAAVARNAGKAAIAAAEYNKGLNRINEQRADDALGKQIAPLFATNRVTQANSGFSFGSGSYLAVTSQAMSNLERVIVQNRNTALQQRAQIGYEGQLTNMGYENQARATEYSGTVAKVNYNYQAAAAKVTAENQARNAEYQGEIAEYQAKAANTKNVIGMVSSAFDAFNTPTAKT